MMGWGNAVFMIEILLAEVIFLFSMERRRGFVLRCVLGAAAAIGAALIFPNIGHYHLMGSPLYQLLRMLTLFAISIGAMSLCFKSSFSALLSGCVAGYAVQHIAYQATKLIGKSGLLTGCVFRQYLLELVIFPPIYLAMFFALGLYAARTEWHKKVNLRFHLVSLAIVFICIGLSRFSRYFGDFGSVSVSLYAITCCLLALVVQFVLCRMADLRMENAALNQLWRDERRQYELSKQTIDIINIKYHDLKHMLSQLKGRLPDEEIASIEEKVGVYGRRVETGNEALDVLLTENSLQCGREGISLTYMGNGADLSFMNVMDVYSLFGNALSNAMEAVLRVDDPEKKIIDIVTERKGDIINISISNYFAHEVTLEDGLPVTTKADDGAFHGFGMKSMRLIAEKYGGRLTVDVDGDMFNLGIYLLSV